jgi:hypothetical protein
MQEAKFKMQNCFVFGVVDSSRAPGFLILHVAFLIELAGRNG